MSKNVLIIGKDFPSCGEFAEGMMLSENNVAVAGFDDKVQAKVPETLKIIEWNKGSAVSAKSTVIKAETVLGHTDDFILYFDSAWFASKFTEFSSSVCASAADELIFSYQYMTLEILNRIKQKKAPARIVFVLKSQPSVKDAEFNPSLKNSVEIPSNAFVAASEAAFATFAENTAVLSSAEQNLSVLLVCGDNANETMQKESGFASWLSGYIDALDNLKSRPSVKVQANWIKAGAKNPGGFGLFK